MSGKQPPKSLRTLSDLIERRATTEGDQTFFRYQDESHSYQDLNRKANSIATKLLERGVQPGDHVSIFMYNRPEYIYTIFGLAKIGAVATPIDTRFTGDVLKYSLSETGAETIILDSETKAAYEEARNRVSNITTEFFVGDQESSHGYLDYGRLLEHKDADNPGIDVDGSDTCSICYIQRYQQKYPQGVQLPQFSYINTGWEFARNLVTLTPDDCVFTTMPLWGSYSVQIGIIGALLAKAEFAFEKQFKRDQFWEWIHNYNATVFLYFGRMLSVLCNQPESDKDSQNPVELAMGHGFGADVDEEMIATFEQRFNTTVLEGYGITPCATMATANRTTDHKPGSVGKPVSHVELEIVDDNEWMVPPGETGEIVVRSKIPNAMMQGFYNDSELTAEVCRNQWIHTNDIGYKDEDGYVYFVAHEENTIQLGRIAGQISSLEIESVLESYPGITDSIILGVSNSGGEEEIKAVIVPDEETNLTPIEVSEYCEKQLEYHKLPRYIEIRSEIPRDPTGKVRKEQLQSAQPADNVWDRESGYNLDR